MDALAIAGQLEGSDDKFVQVIGKLLRLKTIRGGEYNRGDVKLEDYFPFGRVSYAQMIHVKGLRMKSLCDGTGTAQDAKFLDTCLDTANYAIFAAMAELEKPA